MASKIEVSVANELRSAAKAMRRVTAAIFKGSPGLAPTIRGKRKTAQFTLKLNNAKDKQNLAGIAREEILGKIFQGRAGEIQRVMKKALEAVIAGLVGEASATVRVFGRSLGRAKPDRNIDQEPFARFIKSRAGAGEIGLPDPEGSLQRLQAALLEVIKVNVVIRKTGPQVKFTFDQRKLLKLTPHPDRMEGASNAPFFSWLSLVTGPDFVSGGTPGYAKVTVRQLRAGLRKSKKSVRRANIVEGLIRASRTRGNAGELAAIMMSTRAGKARSPAEVFGGTTEDYQPNPRYQGFWDKWWLRNKTDLGVWTRKVMTATVRELLREGK